MMKEKGLIDLPTTEHANTLASGNRVVGGAVYNDVSTEMKEGGTMPYQPPYKKRHPRASGRESLPREIETQG